MTLCIEELEMKLGTKAMEKGGKQGFASVK